MLGWSDGGTTSMIHAAKYQVAVQKLVLWGTNSFMLPHEIELYKNVKDVNKWSNKMRTPMERIYGDYFPQYWSALLDGLIAKFKSKNGNICSEMLKDIRCPTLIMHEEKDPMVAPVHATYFHKHIQGSRLQLYPEGKHNIHLKYAEDFNKKSARVFIKLAGRNEEM
nr:valacyclovir hydrolase-like isoform X1 [Plodia interpunctella]